jgi:serine/threonine protein kinase/tetratricopeptide (TPR) repeat protein
METRQPGVDTLFCEALEIPSAEGRAAYLDRVCGGDDDLRRRVQSLLDAHQRAGGFLESPAASPTTSRHEATLPESPGTVIGPYKLLEVIGEGGMGVVYVAEQTTPVRRRVALKVIKPGMDSKQVVARFEAERQALAMMDHPNIAHVNDGGTTGSGRPYFVMELVRGIPITDYCDRERLSIPERLELFVQVCRAVQHAHQKGIIHRDLKPSNILVTVIDGAAVPKVIDFGVAKATGASLTERTIYTAFQQFVGTPMYMSPEQADLSGVDVDTRSDIYSLGVVLYELLTGTTPFDQETFRKVALDELRRIIREEEPQKPSTRLSSLGETLTTVSANRKANARHLDRTVRGELDWIVMKALEKDRRRRYETANDFAADVMRYLTEQPVEACPPSGWYRFTKYARRNRLALTTVAIVATAVIAGATVAVWQAVRAEELRVQAERRLHVARRAVDEMYFQFAEKWLAQQPKLTQVQSEFLEKALASYEQFAAEQSDDPQAQFDAARAQLRVGRIRTKLGKPDLTSALGRGVEQLETLAARFPDQDQYQNELALGLLYLQDYRAAHGGGGFNEQHIRRSVGLAEALVARHPKDRDSRDTLARSLHSLGSLCLGPNRWDEAERTHRRCREVLAGLIADAPQEPEFRGRLAACENNLGIVFDNSGRLPEAEAAWRRAVELHESVLASDATDPESRKGLAIALMNIAALQHKNGQLDESIATNRRSETLLQALVSEFPDVLEYRQRLVASASNLFGSLLQAGQIAEAEQVGLREVQLGERLIRDDKYDYVTHRRLAGLLRRMSHHRSMSPDERFHNPTMALELARRAVEMDQGSDDWAWQSLGWAEGRLANWRGCIEALEKQSSYARDGDFFAAIAYWHLGDQTKARELFDRSERWFANLGTRWDPSVYPLSAMLQSIRAEAAALLGLADLPDDVFARP